MMKNFFNTPVAYITISLILGACLVESCSVYNSNLYFNLSPLTKLPRYNESAYSYLNEKSGKMWYINVCFPVNNLLDINGEPLELDYTSYAAFVDEDGETLSAAEVYNSLRYDAESGSLIESFYSSITNCYVDKDHSKRYNVTVQYFCDPSSSASPSINVDESEVCSPLVTIKSSYACPRNYSTPYIYPASMHSSHNSSSFIVTFILTFSIFSVLCGVFACVMARKRRLQQQQKALSQAQQLNNVPLKRIISQPTSQFTILDEGEEMNSSNNYPLNNTVSNPSNLYPGYNYGQQSSQTTTTTTQVQQANGQNQFYYYPNNQIPHYLINQQNNANNSQLPFNQTQVSQEETDLEFAKKLQQALNYQG